MDESYRWWSVDLDIPFKTMDFSMRNRKTDPANRLQLHGIEDDDHDGVPSKV
jgi:hypothetical protein